ncbi:MAG: response regulator [Lachnospiraceae bacterium]|nr:response regulator [Lachnospiraceae bacterium]
MKERKVSSEVSRISHIALVITINVFSAVLVLLNSLMNWDLWTTPLFICVAVVTVAMYFTSRASNQHTMYFYASMIMLELFYYCVKAPSVYDATPVIIIALIMLALSGNRNVIRACILIGYLGFFFKVYISHKNGHDILVTKGDVMTLIMHLFLVTLAGFAVMRVYYVWKKSEDMYKKRITQIEEENRKANDFMANVSHEIRTPVNAVIGLTNVIMDRISDKDAKEDIRSVNDAGHRVADQISDILDYTEIDMNKLVVNDETYMLSSLIDDIATKLNSIARPEVEVIFDISADIPSVLIGDISKIRRVLWHIISNGIKFTKSGGVYIRVYSLRRQYGVNLCVEVTDTGVGMDDDEIGRVLDKFYQANSGRNRAAGGLGLGMSIAHGFVKAMGGFLTIESKKGEGTKVCVSIPQHIAEESSCMAINDTNSLCLASFLHFDKYQNPQVRAFYNNMIKNLVQGLGIMVYRVDKLGDLKKLQDIYNLTHLFMGTEEYNIDPAYIEALAAQIEVIVIADTRFEPSPGTNVRVVRKPFYGFPLVNLVNSGTYKRNELITSAGLYCPGVKALVVDDERMNLLVAEGIFKKYGMVVTTVGTGVDAVNICKKQSFDLIFMDHMMPEMDGIEAMKQIRTNAGKEGKELTIIALTANAVSSAREMFLNEGFDEFVPKPIENADLERVLRRVLPKSAIIELEGEKSQEKKDDIFYDTITDTTSFAKSENEIGESFAKLTNVGIDTLSAMKYCQNDSSFYVMLLKNFALDFDNKAPELKTLFEEKNWHDYSIRVHALKSASKMIGHDEMSSLSSRLEEAAKADDGHAVEAEHGKLMSMYTEVVSLIRQTYKMPNEDIPEIASAGIADVSDNEEEYEVLEFKPE